MRMKLMSRVGMMVGAVGIGLLGGLVTLRGQVGIITPAGAAASTTPAVTAPATAPTAEAVLENLLRQAPVSPVIPPTGDGGSAMVVGVDGAAPKQPTVTRMAENQAISGRLGRLVKDEKGGGWLFAFESDGKEMKDPPLGLLPSQMLMAMENASENGAKAVKFKISGLVTEYHGRNYLLVTKVQVMRDMNQF